MFSFRKKAKPDLTEPRLEQPLESADAATPDRELQHTPPWLHPGDVTQAETDGAPELVPSETPKTSLYTRVTAGFTRMRARSKAATSTDSQADVEQVESDTPVSPFAGDTEARQATKNRVLQFFSTGASGVKGLPIKIILGYFPDISEQDAREYAQGVAEKHFEQQGMVHFHAFKYDSGYIYEVHEGGDGRAYTPSVLKYFKSHGSFEPGERLTVVLQTATRYVEVQRLRDGIATILLPESSIRTPTEGIVGTKQMTPALSRRTLFFKSSLVVFATGVLALLTTGTLFRLQPFDYSVTPKSESISAAQLPRTQWAALLAVPVGHFVKAVRFKNGKWLQPETETEDDAKPIAASPPVDPRTTSATTGPRP